MQLFMVGHHDTVEDSFWRVAAESPEQAAQLYIQAMIDEEISVDEEELADLGELEVQTLIPEMPAAPVSSNGATGAPGLLWRISMPGSPTGVTPWSPDLPRIPRQRRYPCPEPR